MVERDSSLNVLILNCKKLGLEAGLMDVLVRLDLSGLTTQSLSLARAWINGFVLPLLYSCPFRFRLQTPLRNIFYEFFFLLFLFEFFFTWAALIEKNHFKRKLEKWPIISWKRKSSLFFFLLNSADLRTRNSFESFLGLFVIALNLVLLSCQLSSTAPFSLNLCAVVATQVVARPPSSLEVPSSNPGFVLHLFVLLLHNNVKKFICS